MRQRDVLSCAGFGARFGMRSLCAMRALRVRCVLLCAAWLAGRGLTRCNDVQHTCIG
jgi:hypothetical protein